MTELEWLHFKKDELSKLNQNDVDILPTLKLSYKLLPACLKQCFAYCRLFPKDQIFSLEQIVDLWRAQGYINNSSASVLSAKEFGLGYWEDLHWRSFVEINMRDESGDMIDVKMHDLMHDLAIYVAGTSTTLSMSNSEDVDEKARHVSFYPDNNLCSRWQAPSSLFRASKLRTILFPSGDWRLQIGEGQCHAIFSCCRCLRVLDLHSLGVKIVPRSISKLRHLRYLDLSDNEDLERLPVSVSRLHNLEVLILNRCIRLQRLPRDIDKLVNLRRLSLCGCAGLTCMPFGIGKLTSLQELSKFVVSREKSSSAGLGELSGLNCLGGRLRIENLQFVKNGSPEFKEANLKMKHHIQGLDLSWTEGDGHDPKWNDVAGGD